jgi:glucosyl-3-phosphoglycerate synthase
MNGLTLDRHAEEKAVEVFASNVLKAGMAFLQGGDEIPFIPTWHRVSVAYPDVYTDMLAAVAGDLRNASRAQARPALA